MVYRLTDDQLSDLMARVRNNQGVQPTEVSTNDLHMMIIELRDYRKAAVQPVTHRAGINLLNAAHSLANAHANLLLSVERNGSPVLREYREKAVSEAAESLELAFERFVSS